MTASSGGDGSGHVTRLTIEDSLKPVPVSRHPFQFCALVSFWLIGWVTIIADPDTIFSQSVSHFIDFVYGLLLILSCTTAIVGSWWKERISGFLLEKIGLIGVCMGSTIYGVFLFFVFGQQAISAMLNVGIGVACAWRVRNVNQELRSTIRLIHSRGSGTE